MKVIINKILIIICTAIFILSLLSCHIFYNNVYASSLEDTFDITSNIAGKIENLSLFTGGNITYSNGLKITNKKDASDDVCFLSQNLIKMAVDSGYTKLKIVSKTNAEKPKGASVWTTITGGDWLESKNRNNEILVNTTSDETLTNFVDLEKTLCSDGSYSLCFKCGGGWAGVYDSVFYTITELTFTDRVVTPESAVFTMEKGASVRMNTTDGHNGLRYSISIDKSEYDALQDSIGEGKAYQKVSFGILIAPKSYDDVYELNEENVFGANRKYSYAVLNKDGVWEYDEAGNIGKIRIMNHQIDIMVSLGNKMVCYGAITDIKQENLVREFVGVGYIKYEKNGVVHYRFLDRNDNTRSICYVAQRAIEDDAISVQDKTWLQKNYVDSNKTINSNYTIKHYFKSDNGYILDDCFTTVKTAFIDTTITVDTINGFTVNEEKSIKTGKVYANSKREYSIYYDIPSDSLSSYKILLSSDATSDELSCASELQSLYKKATGIDLSIVTYKTINNYGKYISIGNTSLKEKFDKDVTFACNDSYLIKTVGNSYILQSNSGNGLKYVVNGFLNKSFGMEIYAIDEIVFSNKDITSLPQINVVENPDFSERYISNNTITNSNVKREYAIRSNLDTENTSNWSKQLGSHTYFKLCNPSKYFNEHNDWYYVVNGEPIQLCLSKMLSDSTMYNIVLNNLKSYIELEPDKDWFMFGSEDNGEQYCNCNNCKALYKKYDPYNGGQGSSLTIVATNKLASDIKAWLLNTYLERANKVKIGFFAYSNSIYAPVKDGKYTKEVVCNDNVIVRLAIIMTSYLSNMDSTANQIPAQAIKDFGLICKNLSIWTYSSSFIDYRVPFIDVETMQNHYKYYKENNVIDVYNQGVRETSGTPFEYYRNYVSSKLMWNVDEDITKLQDDFFNSYYGVASDYVLDYYNKLVNHYKNLESQYSMKTQVVQKSLLDKKYWSKQFLNECLDILNNGLIEIEKIDDSVLREKYYQRVLTETLFAKAYLIELYGDTYKNSEITAMINEYQISAKKCSLEYYKEGWYKDSTSIETVIKKWRNKYFEQFQDDFFK